MSPSDVVSGKQIGKPIRNLVQLGKAVIPRGAVLPDENQRQLVRFRLGPFVAYIQADVVELRDFPAKVAAELLIIFPLGLHRR